MKKAREDLGGCFIDCDSVKHLDVSVEYRLKEKREDTGSNTTTKNTNPFLGMI